MSRVWAHGDDDEPPAKTRRFHEIPDAAGRIDEGFLHDVVEVGIVAE